MTPQQIRTALDAHDALLKACLDGGLSFQEFLGAYLGFPGSLVQDPDARRLFARRIEFHTRVAQILAGLDSLDDAAGAAEGALSSFIPRIGLMRLRALYREHPDLSGRLRG